MTRDDIIRMAQKAGLYHFYDSEGHCDGITDARLVTEDRERDDDRLVEMLAPFVSLVATAERERVMQIVQSMKADLEAKFENVYMEGAMAGAAAEREACAKVCDELIADTPDNDPDSDAIGACAIAIRARSNP